MAFMTILWLGKPLWMWLVFMVVVGLLLALDLGVLHRKHRVVGVRESLLLSAGYIAMGLLFGVVVWWQLGADAAMRYVTGFVVEKSLALDNIFVIALIFGFFAVPRQYQHRVLFWGILGAIVMRGLMIGGGAVLVARFDWILYVFAAFLVLSGIRMLLVRGEPADLSKNPLLRFMRNRFRITEEPHGEHFLVKLPDPRTGRMVRYMTPLFLALVSVEVADVIFAVDSIPAIFAITSDPYLIYTSNIFAILGLRALYFALAAVMHRFAYLKHALAVLLIFIGGKVFLTDFLGIVHIPEIWSLAITFAILLTGILWSLWRSRFSRPHQPKKGST
ncbi:tellurite resistance protein TerC [Pontibaca methylaminivorans]|uniref:Tellurite resistance protein TerC n=2 Tax=Pontibaca methylaminivorans TaxID=515897 RepID=A0A1R3X2E0_9RHOB|nr:tellurite resistance protein TerC [Pontibaca methylaminivorans]